MRGHRTRSLLAAGVMLGAAAAGLLLSIQGCFNPAQPICAFSCALPPNACPNGYVCRGDQFCHRAGTSGSCPNFAGPEAGPPHPPDASPDSSSDGLDLDASNLDGPDATTTPVDGAIDGPTDALLDLDALLGVVDAIL